MIAPDQWIIELFFLVSDSSLILSWMTISASIPMPIRKRSQPAIPERVRIALKRLEVGQRRNNIEIIEGSPATASEPDHERSSTEDQCHADQGSVAPFADGVLPKEKAPPSVCYDLNRRGNREHQP